MLVRNLLALVSPPLCVACGATAGAAEPLCSSCRAELRWLGHATAGAGSLAVWAPLAYEGPARALVRALKFGGLARARCTMAAQIAANAPPAWLTHGRLVPVPLHPARLRRRGYNQAERLAAALSERTGLATHDCLERLGPAATQVGRARAERLEAMAGSVGLRAHRAAPARAILVDDVMTTGATLAACAEALRRAGTEELVGLTYARTPGR